MESTFTPGLGKTVLERRLQRDLEAKETPFERQRRRAKEKRKARRAERKAAAAAAAAAAPEPTAAPEAGKSAAARRRERKEKKRKAAAKEAEFKVDLGDARFTQLLSDPQYAVNPQDKSFKDTPNMQRIIQERQKRRKRQ